MKDKGYYLTAILMVGVTAYVVVHILSRWGN